MIIAIIPTSKRATTYPKKLIPTNCSGILTDNPNIRRSAEDDDIYCVETSLRDAVEKADYVIVLCGKSTRQLASVTAKCRKHNKSFEIVMVE